jgi:hypothetical protein
VNQSEPGRGLERGQARGRPRGARGHPGDTFSERLTPAGRGRAPEAADTEMQGHSPGSPGQIGQRTPVVTMEVRGRLGTVGTSGLGSRDGHTKCEAMVLQNYGIKV